MNSATHERYLRATSDPLDTLISANKNDKISYLVSGSTDTKYRVTIDYNTGAITCTCKDYECNCKRLECLCKHCLHIIDSYEIFNPNHTFFTRLYFTPDEIESIQSYK